MIPESPVSPYDAWAHDLARLQALHEAHRRLRLAAGSVVNQMTGVLNCRPDPILTAEDLRRWREQLAGAMEP